jgi:hypothetical protein
MSKLPGDEWHGFLVVGDSPELFAAYEDATLPEPPIPDSDIAARRQRGWEVVLASVHQALSRTREKVDAIMLGKAIS